MGKNTQAEVTVEELQAQNAELENKLAYQAEQIASAEKLITELMDKLQSTEHALVTGEVIVESGGQKYKVIGKHLPTLSQASNIGAKSIPAQDAAQHPEVIAELIAIGSGFLQPLTD
jgi:hypothetical protein